MVVTVLILSLTACNPARPFDQAAWQQQPVETNNERSPRCLMVDDLLENHLKIGMTRSEVVALLGNAELGSAELEGGKNKGEEIAQPIANFYVGRCNTYSVDQYELELIFDGQYRLEQFSQIRG
jgi:hypothetical protein